MRPKSYNFIIPLVIYPFDMMVSLGEPDDVLISKLKKAGVDVGDANIKSHSTTNRGRCVIFESGQTLIRMFQLKNTPEWYGFLQHEVFHAVEFIMERIGMRLTIDSDEAYAYLIGYLTTEIYKRINNK